MAEFFTDPPERVRVSPDGKEMTVPGQSKPQAIIGPTPDELARRKAEHSKRMAHLQRQMRSTFRCTECKRVWAGTQVRVTVRNIGGVKAEVLVCPDQKCDGPVVMVQDALSLTNPPKDTGR